MLKGAVKMTKKGKIEQKETKTLPINFVYILKSQLKGIDTLVMGEAKKNFWKSYNVGAISIFVSKNLIVVWPASSSVILGDKSESVRK